jgi:hypothetical protein
MNGRCGMCGGPAVFTLCSLCRFSSNSWSLFPRPDEVDEYDKAFARSFETRHVTTCGCPQVVGGDVLHRIGCHNRR